MLGQMRADDFDTSYTAANDDTMSVWNAAMADYVDYSGTPLRALDTLEDETFLAGPAFCAAMRILGGVSSESRSLQSNLAAMRQAAPNADPAEQGHAKAVEALAAGAFSDAARHWDAVLEARPNDILAHKCAHETWFLTGNIPEMRRSGRTALDRLTADDPVFAIAAANYAFSLEESGDLAPAEAWGRLALDMRPTDCWALHCLAHVFETQNRHQEAMSLLKTKQPIWKEQNLLDAHIWWHLTLRQVEEKSYDAALAVYDETLAEVHPSNRYRLTDGTSLLWRLELEGVDVGGRWQAMADKWAKNATVHNIAFLDLHAALAFARCPDHAAADQFFDSLDTAFEGLQHENARIHQEVLQPLAKAVRIYRDDQNAAAKAIAPLLPELHRLGGSIVQRELVERSYSSALLATSQAEKAADWLDPKLAQYPNTPWILKDRAKAAEATGDVAQATILNRRADLMFGGWS